MGRVQFLKPLEWIAPALTAFRERPLPSSYQDFVQPTFDLFGNSRVAEIEFEEVLGPIGQIEVVSPDPTVTPGGVREGFYRQYLSFAFVHNDPAARLMMGIRVVADPTLGFPFAPLTDQVVTPQFEWRVARNTSVPPKGFIGCRVNALGAGTRITLRSLFVELPVGEPFGTIA